MRILDNIFGNKIVIVTATKLYGYAEWEEDFVFHKSITKDQINATIRSLGQYVDSIKRKRTTKIISPDPGKFRSMNNKRIIKWYD